MLKSEGHANGTPANPANFLENWRFMNLAAKPMMLPAASFTEAISLPLPASLTA
jgi:hypothetical protein